MLLSLSLPFESLERMPPVSVRQMMAFLVDVVVTLSPGLNENRSS
jgi:hypothetical protein